MSSAYRSLLLAIAFLGVSAAARGDEIADRVDKLLARFDRADAPGCVVAVARGRDVIYERGFGSADLEHRLRITPETAFPAASVSKHVTAFALLLLERDGKLSLDDDVRKHLPELHDFGKTITLRHLLQHTSGLRDQWGLLMLSGWRIDDVITQDDVLEMIWRQRQLNYDPGAEFLYCNTGFTLAAEVVRSASGKPLPEFARERQFAPLGLKHARFCADYRELVPGRALSYHPNGDGTYRNVPLALGTVGATGLWTTAGDLARWAGNLCDPRVGDKTLVARLEEPGRLNDGRPTGYALGLEVGEYRGLKTVGHGGSDAAFRCMLLQFPSERLSVVVLANGGDFDAEGTARKVAEVFLEGRLKSADAEAPRPTKEVAVEVKLLDAYAGEYRISPGMLVTVTREGGRLFSQATGHPKAHLVPVSDTEFVVRGTDTRFTFDRPEGGQSARVVIRYAGLDLPARRVARPVVPAATAAGYAGDYHSRELGVVYEVSSLGGEVLLGHPRGAEVLRPVAADEFEAPYPFGRVVFARSDGGQVLSLAIDAGAVRNLRFTRVDIRPAR